MISAARADTPSPPRFLRLAGHPVRWRLLSELARSDRRVGELCELAEERQSLVSYHLRQLRDGGMVSVSCLTMICCVESPVITGRAISANSATSPNE